MGWLTQTCWAVGISGRMSIDAGGVVSRSGIRRPAPDAIVKRRVWGVSESKMPRFVRFERQRDALCVVFLLVRTDDYGARNETTSK